MAAPSPSTNPSRSRSNGRDARDGSSCRVDRARSAPNAASVTGWAMASVPPATARSISSSRNRRTAWAMASDPEAQALASEVAAARAPISAASSAELALAMMPVMVWAGMPTGPLAR